jgi:hypothetical protein
MGDGDGVGVFIEDLLDATLVRSALLGLDVVRPRVIVFDIVEFLWTADDFGGVVGLWGREVGRGCEGALVVGCRRRQQSA